MTQLNGKLLLNEPLARYTSWRVGGPADKFYIPAGLDDLRTFLQSLDASEPITFIGLGSNLLVRDGGVRGTVVLMHNVLTALHARDRPRMIQTCSGQLSKRNLHRSGNGIVCQIF